MRRNNFCCGQSVTSEGSPFYRSDASLVPELLAGIREIYKVPVGRFLVAESSNNGGIAFAVAVRNLKLFASLTERAGYPEVEEDLPRLDRLPCIKNIFIVGDGDLYWKEAR